MNFNLKTLLQYYFLTASGALAVLAAGSVGLSWYTGDMTYFWVAGVGYMVHQARLENPTVIVLSEKHLQQEPE